MNGKKLIKSTTFTPPKDVTAKKAEKLAQEYAPIELKASTVYIYK